MKCILSLLLMLSASAWGQLPKPGGSSSGGSGGGGVSTVVKTYGALFASQSGVLAPGFTVYVSVPTACTIIAWDIQLDTGTATVDVWKVASGTAVPTIANTITASALPAISTGTAARGTTLTGWTTAANANDIFGFNLKLVSSATQVGFQLECREGS